ncbi:MAG: efflux RND transporter permease subunit [Planctomycetota bacterium]|nr:efflux RND transporter permease subunit [Planctomycetota bacterium]
MFNLLIRLALRYRFPVIVVSLALLAYGSYLATTMPIDVFPDLDRPRVILLTECPGLSSEEVETLVTQPVEVSLLGASGVEAVRSQSTAGLAVVFIEFGWNTNIQAARQTVQERLASLSGVLPDGIHPEMTPPSSIMGQVVIAGMYRQKGPNGGRLVAVEGTPWMAELLPGDDEPGIKIWNPVDRHALDAWLEVKPTGVSLVADGEPGDSEFSGEAKVTIDGKDFRFSLPAEFEQEMDLGTIGDWVVRTRLLKIKGVAEAFLQGAERKQYQILVDPSALVEYGVSLQNIEQALKESNINTSGGYAITGESERPIRILGRVGPDRDKVLRDLSKVPVRGSNKRPVLLEQVATVTEGAEFKRGDGAVNGRPGLVFSIVKQPHVDTRQLTDEVASALEEVEATLPADIVINSELFRLRNFIDRGIFNVGEALVTGAVLVIIILFLFLLNFRTTFITLTAIPLSLVVTTVVFRLIGYLSDTNLTINVMTLGGIAVAMGELVDDAIVDVENIFRRLKENYSAENPQPTIRVVYEASREIRSAIVFGTIVVILVLLPLFAISGVAGRLFQPMGLAYIVSILSSLLVSLTVTPVLSYYLLPGSRATRRQKDGFLLWLLKQTATPLVRLSMAIPGSLLLWTWFAVAIVGVMCSRLGGSFLPDFDEGSIQVNVTLPPGSSLQASSQVSELIDARFRDLQVSPENPGGAIRYFVRRTGRAEMDEHASPVNFGEYILNMNPETHLERDEIIRVLLEELKEEVPGVSIEVEQPLAHLISHMVSGVYAQIAIKIFGDDLDKLQSIANQVKSKIQNIDGITEPIVEPIRQTEELHIQLRADDLAVHGITRAYVARVLQTALQGEVVSQVLDGQRRFDLLIRLEEKYRTDYVNLGRLRIDLPDNRGQIELSDVGEIERGVGPNAIFRENARRRIVIRCNTLGRDLSSAVQEIRNRIGGELELPAGYFVEFAGQFESQRKATQMILVLSGVAVIGMVVVLMLLVPSLRIVLQILNALPTAFIGGVLALYLTEQDLTVASLVGFISLGGIAVRNGILLVTHYLYLIREEGASFSKETLLRGSLERLSPVLMTALTAGIALIPLVLGGKEPGREILYPVATVILGGLFTSTFCEFLIHPGLFWRFSGKDAVKLASKSGLEEI